MSAIRFVLTLSMLAIIGGATVTWGEEATETAKVAKLGPDGGNRVYIPDMAFSHWVDGRVHVLDRQNLRYLGVIPAAYLPQFVVAPDRKHLYVATTYYSRLNRGTRTDTIDVWDAETLAVVKEIEVPPKHALAIPYSSYLALSEDGGTLYSQNATPASSVAIVDTAEGKFLSEIETAGCWGLYPAPGKVRRFSSLCGDGTVLTIDVDAKGKEIARKRSKRLFDPKDDALFTVAANTGAGKYLFMSFHGNVHLIDVSGSVAVQDEPWSIIPEKDSEGWRPGGYQPLTYNRELGRLYVGMHPKGGEGTHKAPAKEVWQFDVAKHSLVDRSPVEDATAISITNDKSPSLFALSANGTMSRFDASGPLKKDGSLESLVENAIELVAQY